jgi:hypothetical protein
LARPFLAAGDRDVNGKTRALTTTGRVLGGLGDGDVGLERDSYVAALQEAVALIKNH